MIALSTLIAMWEGIQYSTCLIKLVEEWKSKLDNNLLEGSIFLEEIELVVGKLETLTSGPGGTIVTVNAPELVDVGDGPSVGGSVESVLNLMNVCIPRHFALFYRQILEFLMKYNILFIYD